MSELHDQGADVQRRARPLLGTLVEISLPAEVSPACFEAAFAAIGQVQGALSRFEPDSELSRFHALATGESLALQPLSQRVFAAAAWLQAQSEGLFDISQGSAPQGWRLQGGRLHKLASEVALDLGGLAKGYAVDRAVAALRRCGAAWVAVNAGGDLRVSGPRPVALQLRDEEQGAVRPFAELCNGSFATSCYLPHSRSRLFQAAAGQRSPARHVSVAAPRCLWADALCKIVAASGDASHPLLSRLQAQAWLHGETT
ncbi:FAD:protein FMN transferase [Paucibacter sp. APW11]|uniref:FAD:protein FMN transferase n=1 Tax=Roseateles aquae TaxID=3077235 RepID=A0ABU3P5N5_9BURK|nr:FAD:protein FMN transferase [Paucibacter sp. APW11]MDT8997889.1 FAD:protein FMN transferase [Paucibacter sp. APW11]